MNYQDLATKISQKIESEQTLKPVFTGGIFGGKPKAEDAIFFNASKRGVAVLETCIRKEYTLGNLSYLCIFNPNNAVSKEEINHVINKGTELGVDAYKDADFGVADGYLREFNASPQIYPKEHEVSANILKQFDAVKSPDSVVIVVGDGVFDDKDRAASGYPLVVYAYADDTIYVSPISNKRLEKILKKL